MEKKACLLFFLIDVRYFSLDQLRLTQVVLKEHLTVLDFIFRKCRSAVFIPSIISLGVSPKVLLPPKQTNQLTVLLDAFNSLLPSNGENSPTQVSAAFETVLELVNHVDDYSNFNDTMKKIFFISSDTTFGGALNISQLFRKFSQMGVSISFASVMGDLNENPLLSCNDDNRESQIEHFASLGALFQDHLNCSISRVQNDVGSIRRFFSQELCEIVHDIYKSPPIQIEFGGPFSSNSQKPLYCDVYFEGLPMLYSSPSLSNEPSILKILKRIDLWTLSEELLFGNPVILVASKRDMIEEDSKSTLRFGALYSISQKQEFALLASSSYCFETGTENPSIQYLYLLVASENDCSFFVKKIIGQEQYLSRHPAPAIEENREIFVEVENSLYGLGERIEYNPLDWAVGLYEQKPKSHNDCLHPQGYIVQAAAPGPGKKTWLKTFSTQESPQTMGPGRPSLKDSSSPKRQPSSPLPIHQAPVSKKRKFQRIQKLVNMGS